MEAHPARPKILIVDDAPENIQLLSEMLNDDCQAMSASNGLQALKLATSEPAPEVILLDVVMPGMNGYEICSRLKSDPKTRDIPVIFVSSLNDKDEEHKGLELGAADFITRPFNSKLVRTRVRYQLEMNRYRAQHPIVDAAAITTPELQLELGEQKNLNHELRLLTAALERAAGQRMAELATARETLESMTRTRQKEQDELQALRRALKKKQDEHELLCHEFDSFCYSISHDLRAPLRHVIGFSDALQEDYGAQLDSTAQGFIGCVTRAAHKMEAQVEALTSLSRIGRQPLSVLDVDLSALAQEAVAALQSGNSDRRVEISIATGLKAKGDATLLRTALDCLLDNSWKFTGGKERAEIAVGAELQGEELVYFVRDNGVGFDMKYADRLFGAFQRMHKETEFPGLGIGLATVQRIVHRQGGRIWADTSLEGGATFYFTLGNQE
jgi:signal transduction histidine kinase